MARFFIDRPIFAWVLAIIIMLSGILSIIFMPIEQYPDIAPPVVRITTSYPGASAETVENTVTQNIERKMLGIDNLMYIKSTSDSNGNGVTQLTFEPGTDPDIAQVQVQNQLKTVEAHLPDAVRQQGVMVKKTSDSFLMIASITSSNPKVSRADLSDYLLNNIYEPLGRVNGVGELQVFGSQYAMRIWLDPNKLAQLNLSVADIKKAIKSQNSQVSFGQLGGAPATSAQDFSATIVGRGRLNTSEQFENIVVLAKNDGKNVKLKDIARVELNSESFDTSSLLNGQATAAVGIKLASGANEMLTSKLVREKLDELSQQFPMDYKLEYPNDTTPFVKLSIEEVVETLFEAVILVFLIMYLFLQNFRATLIPTLTVPVVLLGTFGIMSVMGFSINTLSMFGLVLAIGLLVDDAIVVVENVERLMTEESLSPIEATRKSMDQITGALVGISLVLSAVFIPMAFFGGSTGVIYRQFSLTIVAAMGLSVITSMVFTPALCATLLKTTHDSSTRNKFFETFNIYFERMTINYETGLVQILKRGGTFTLIYVLLLCVMLGLFKVLPSSFLPTEDQGSFFVSIQLPDGANLKQTQATLEKVNHYFSSEEKNNVQMMLAVHGFNFSGRGQNMGMAFIKLQPWDLRKNEDDQVDSIIKRANKYFSSIKEANVMAFNQPAIRGLGTSSGFDFFLQDRANLGHNGLMNLEKTFLENANKDPRLANVRANGMKDSPQFIIDIDYEKAIAQGVSIDDINETLSTGWGSSYIDDFIDRGRQKQVIMQAEPNYRMTPDDLNLWYIRNSKGDMVPFSSFASTRWKVASPRLERYDGYSAVEIVGEAAPGYSTGDAMKAVEEIAEKLPNGITVSWTGLSLEEQKSGSQAPYLYAISILFVFLCLAALYESWTIPTSVILVVPLGVIGALVATYMRGLENDVYFQVGLLTTIGLSAKNAILIVEFAKDLYAQGANLQSAVIEAARQRLRPILMTSLAFLLGVLPLAISSGAGANSRHAIGTGVIGGMITATILAIFFVPLFFDIVMKKFPPKMSEQLSVIPESGN